MVDDNNIATINFGEGEELTALVDFVGEKDSPSVKEFDSSRHNVLTLVYGDKEAKFDCWGNYYNPSREQEPESTTMDIVRAALDYIDAIDYEDFCRTFGYEPYVDDGLSYEDLEDNEEYDDHNPEAYAAFEASRETLEKLESIGLSESDIREIEGVLSEKDDNGTLDEYESDLEDESKLSESLVKQFMASYR